MSRRADVSQAAVERAAKATSSRNVHMLWALAIYAAVWILGAVLWLAWGRSDGDDKAGVASLWTVMFILVIWWIGFNSYKRQKNTHAMWASAVLHTILTTACACTYMISAMIAGPVVHPLIDLYFIIGGALTVTWLARLHFERQDAQAHANGKPSARSAAAVLMQAHGKADIDGRVLDSSTPNRTDIELDMSKSDTLAEDLVPLAPHLAKDFGEPRRNVAIIPDEHNEDVVRLEVIHGDPLNERVLWPGPEKPGASPFVPIRTGVREDASIARKIIALETGTFHELICGMTRSGKGNGALIECMELMSRREVRQWVIDPVKGLQTFGRVAAGLDWFIIDHQTTKRFFRNLPKLIKANTQYLASRKLGAWKPGCGIPLTIVWIEEASELDVDWDWMEKGAKAAASAGIVLKFSLQSPQYTQMSPTVRRQMAGTVCYGVNDDFDETMLPPQIQDGTRSPKNWKANHPGRCYEVSPGAGMAEWIRPMRKYDAGEDWAIAERYAAEWGPRFQPGRDPVIEQALGELYTGRKMPLQVVAETQAAAAAMFGSAVNAVQHAASIADARIGFVAEQQGYTVDYQARTATPPPAPADADDDFDNEDESDMDDDRVTLGDLGVRTPDPMPEIDDEEAAAMDMDVPDGDFPLGGDAPASAQPSVSDKEMEALVRRRLIERLHELHADGEDVINAPQFHDAIVASKLRSRPWVHKQLKKLVDAGFLTWDDDEGGYEIVQLPPLENAATV